MNSGKPVTASKVVPAIISSLGGLLLFSQLLFAQQKVDFEKVWLQLGQHQLQVEYAQNWQQRQRGLMYRTSLCDDCGMLFHFDQPQIASMWMKDTLLPLDVAFIDDKGHISDILAMQPRDLTPVKSSRAVRYALEMNQGWFAKHGIQVGDKITLTDQNTD